MKSKILNYILLLIVGATSFSCLERTDNYAPKIPSSGTIQFEVVPGALTGVAAFAAGLPVQPTFDVVAARFSRATTLSPNFVGGNVQIKINVSSSITNVTINMYTSLTAPVRQVEATLTGVSGTATWTRPIAGWTYNGVAVANATYIIEVVGTNSDGTQSTIRTFSLTIIA